MERTVSNGTLILFRFRERTGITSRLGIDVLFRFPAASACFSDRVHGCRREGELENEIARLKVNLAAVWVVGSIKTGYIIAACMFHVLSAYNTTVRVV